ncbi:MAG: Rieske 2Fe-2S domain-containing protein, partial [Comamonas sp.]
MFIKNCWYCAGWDHEVNSGRNALVHRKIAGEDIVFYRTATGKVIAMEDRCPHRHAPLSVGQKEGDGIRCMYHGMKFESDGVCSHVPGQPRPSNACVRVFPVVEKNNWIWVWMGDPAKADPALICDSVGPGHPGYHILTSKMHVKANYRLEIANLMDLSHLTWVHRATLGGTDAYTHAKPRDVALENGR